MIQLNVITVFQKKQIAVKRQKSLVNPGSGEENLRKITQVSNLVLVLQGFLTSDYIYIYYKYIISHNDG